MIRALRALAPAALVPALAGAALAAAPASKIRELPGSVVEFQTADGWTLTGNYLPSKEEDKLTFVLIHESTGRRQNWYWLAKRFEKRGLGFLAFDLRGHGYSTKPPEGKPATFKEFKAAKLENDWDLIREDIAAGIRWLKAQGVPGESIALGGAELGGSLALKSAALTPEVPMVFLLSPGMSYKEVLTVNAMRAYKDRPILLVVGADDRGSSTATRILYEFAKGSAGKENASLATVERGHGTKMLYLNKGLIDRILWWIDDPENVEPVVDPSSGTSSAARAPIEPLPNFADEPKSP